MLTKTNIRIEKSEIEIKALWQELQILKERIISLETDKSLGDKFGPTRMKNEPYSPF